MNPPLRRFTAGIATFILPLILAGSAFAQLPVAKLTAIFPPGGKAGSSVEVKASGADLDDPTGILFSHTGITAKPADSGNTAAEAKFTVSIGADVKPGVYEARVRGRFGVSNPRLFAVGDRPELDKSRPGSTPKDAQPVQFGSIANGRCAVGTTEFYSVDIKKGQRALIVCDTREIDSRMSPVMVLGTTDGRELERGRRNGLIDFTAPADGTYLLEVHDLLYRGGPEYFYRLTVGAGPRVDAIFPPAGEPGSKGKYTIFGRNLPGGSQSDVKGSDGKPLEQISVQIELPSDPLSQQTLQNVGLVATSGAGIDGFEYRVKSDNGLSNPVLIGYAKAPVVEEKEPNNIPEQAQKVSVPCEFVGQFYPRGDMDWLTFDAEKGQSFWIEVIAERLGEPAAPSLLIQKVGKDGKATDNQEPAAMETNIGGAFRTSSRDVSYKFEAKEAATYRILVRDLYNTSSENPSLVYRLSIRQAKPDFRIVALAGADNTPAAKNNNNNNQGNQDPTTPFLRKGGATPVKIVLFRQEGFDGDVKLEAEGLPDGVSCAGATIPGGESVGSMILTASEDVKDWSGAIRIIGKSKIGDQDLTREARGGAVVWAPLGQGNNAAEPAMARLTRDFAIAVTGAETEPLAIRPDNDRYEAKAGDTVKIPLKLTRRGEVKPPIKIKPLGISVFKEGGGGGNAKELTVDGNGDTATLEIDLSKQKLSPGTYTFYVQASAQVKYDRPGGQPAKDDKGKADKGGKNAKDAGANFYSAPITLIVLPAEKKK